MKTFKVCRYSSRGDIIKRYLNKREDCLYVGCDQDSLFFEIPSSLYISFSRRGRIKIRED